MPFDGRCAARLALLAVVGELADAFDVANLLDRWPGKSGKGDRFPLHLARARAAAIVPSLPETVLFAGHNVAAAFGFAALPYLTWACGKRRRVAVIPHPSGVNRWWNISENHVQAGRFIRSAAGPPRR